MGKESIWNRLRELGFNEYASAGIMANIQAESAYISNRVQMGYGWTDEEYTKRVDEGTYDYTSYLYDAIGYGLIQWTYWSRKQGLYNLAKRRQVSIGDESMQLDFMYYELSTGYATAFNKLLEASSAYDSAYWFCTDFEKPADTINQAKYRGNLANAIYQEFAGTPISAQATTEEIAVADEDEENVVYIEATSGEIHLVKYGDNDLYVNAVQSLLKQHGYDLKIDADYGDETSSALKTFQAQHGLDDDGICGELTWNKLISD